MTHDYTIHCLSEALSPITHMARSEGNESLVAREPIITPNGVRHLPYLSGNAIRHRFVRAPGARWLITRLGLLGKLTLQQLNFFLHGGNLTEGGGTENTRRIADMQTLFPLLRLLGGCLPNQILKGSLAAWRGTLVCEENRAYMASVLPSGFTVDKPLRPAESEVSGYQYTRSDAAKTSPDLVPADAEVESNLMIFSGQAVTRGSLFLHGFQITHASRLELGALYHSLGLWQQEGGTVGGQAARGHGRLRLSILGGDEEDQAAAVTEYIAHVDVNQPACVAWLADAFKAKEKKEPKAKKEKPAKGKKPEAEPEPAPDAEGALYG